MCELNVLGWQEKDSDHIQIGKHSRLPSSTHTKLFWPLGVQDSFMLAVETSYKSALV